MDEEHVHHHQRPVQLTRQRDQSIRSSMAPGVCIQAAGFHRILLYIIGSPFRKKRVFERTNVSSIHRVGMVVDRLFGRNIPFRYTTHVTALVARASVPWFALAIHTFLLQQTEQ
jgi:hypothetical protein